MFWVTCLSLPPALVGVLQRNRPTVHVCVCVLIYYKRWVHTIMEAASPEICNLQSATGDPGELMG